jgi:hypothetical protein
MSADLPAVKVAGGQAMVAGKRQHLCSLVRWWKTKAVGP